MYIRVRIAQCAVVLTPAQRTLLLQIVISHSSYRTPEILKPCCLLLNSRIVIMIAKLTQNTRLIFNYSTLEVKTQYIGFTEECS